MKRPNHYSQIAAIAIAALALSHAPSFADNEQVEVYQMTVVAKNGAKQSVVLVKPDVVRSITPSRKNFLLMESCMPYPTFSLSE